MTPLIDLKKTMALLVALFELACFAPSSTAQADICWVLPQRFRPGSDCFQVRLGGVFGRSGGIGVPLHVVIGRDGELGTRSSSERFETDIATMEKASEVILSLRPVTFYDKTDIATPQFGLIAEEVAKVNPDLVVPDEEGKPYAVRYDVVNAMLLNEFLKAHERIEEQEKRIEQLAAQLKEQALLIQKLNDKVELNRTATKAVLNNQ